MRHHAANEGLFADVTALGSLQGVEGLAGNLQLRGSEGEGQAGARDQQGVEKLAGRFQLRGRGARVEGVESAGISTTT